MNQSKATSRFNQNPYVKDIIELIEKLRNKEKKLKEAALRRGISSLDFKKHTIVADILDKIDCALYEFNQSPPLASLLAESSALETLISKLHEIVYKNVRHDNKILAAQRDPHKENAKALLFYSTLIAGITAIGLSLTTLVLPFVSTSLAGSLTGLNDVTAHTVYLLTDLCNALHNLQEYIKRNKPIFIRQEVNTQRTWACLALSSSHSLFSHLPKDIKEEVLAYIWNGKQAKQLNQKMLVAADKVCRENEQQAQQSKGHGPCRS